VPDEGLLRGGDFTAAGGHAAMDALLDRAAAGGGPTAVFASNDLMAIGAICAASSHGLRIPRDLSVIGFDDIALAAHSNPPLSTIAQPKHETGAVAAQLLLQRIADPHRGLQRAILQPSLVARQSTGAVAPGAMP
jgi:LacI family transcriptional regulator